MPVQNLKSTRTRRRAAEVQRPESGTTTGLAGWPTGPTGQDGAWGTGRSWHGHHTAGSASASVGSPVYKRRVRAVERDSDSNGVRARHCFLQSVSQVSRSVGTGRASFGREARQNQSRHKSVADKFSTPLSGRASVQHPNQTRFDGGELDLVIFGAHPPTAAEIAVIQHGRIT